MQALPHIISIAREAGRIIMDWRAKGVEVQEKSSTYDLVTSADFAADEYIRNALEQMFPGDHILTEESGLTGNLDGRVWMVDPLDGTKDFAYGGNMFSVMIGLCVDGVPVLGVVYSPTDDLLYYATKDGGAYMVRGDNEQRLQVSTIDRLSDARFVARVRHAAGDVRTTDTYIESIPVREHIPMSSGGLKLGLIAQGLADVTMAFPGRIGKWDTCAPQIILEEAGGIYTDGDGDPLDYRCEGTKWNVMLVASNKKVHQQILDYIKSQGSQPDVE